VKERPDGLEIEGRGRVEAFEGQSCQDHRIALSLMVAALAAKGPSRIFGGDCMDVSYPNFMEQLSPLVER
jgi:3-phosphoshikimate 1-carboxyvinyltransferase